MSSASITRPCPGLNANLTRQTPLALSSRSALGSRDSHSLAMQRIPSPNSLRTSTWNTWQQVRWIEHDMPCHPFIILPDELLISRASPAEYPLLRPFTLLPGIVATDMNAAHAASGNGMDFYARDEAEQTGAFGLYLASSPRSDYLVGSLTSINWDVAELEAHKDTIRSGLLKNKWVAVLPASGGEGL